jgi:hypothetical protein
MHSFTIFRAARNSSRPETMGNITRTFPWADARKIARICVRNSPDAATPTEFPAGPKTDWVRSCSFPETPGPPTCPPDIQGAQNHRMGQNRLGHLGVKPVVVFFRGQPVPVQIKELGAIKAHPFGAVGQQIFDLAGRIDVARQRDPTAIQWFGPFDRAAVPNPAVRRPECPVPGDNCPPRPAGGSGSPCRCSRPKSSCRRAARGG